jgi:hypothetical protein
VHAWQTKTAKKRARRLGNRHREIAVAVSILVPDAAMVRVDAGCTFRPAVIDGGRLLINGSQAKVLV